MRTIICDLLGIEYPIIQGGMAWVATAELAAAVSNAGGFGIIGSGGMTGELLEKEILRCKGLTEKPFGVNILLTSPNAEACIKVACEQKVKAVTTGAGNAGKYAEMLKEAGVLFMPLVPSVALAKRMQGIGASIIIAEGTEAGGHIGELTTMTLVPQVVDAVDVPVIAAGGIADGRGVAAAFALGAVGVQVGTRFICAKEGTVSDEYKNAVVEAKDRDAVVTGRATGHPVRGIKNKLTREFDKLEKDNASVEEYEKLGTGRLAAAFRGDVEFGAIMAGQSAAMVCKIEPAKDIILSLINEGKSVMKELSRFE